MAINKKLIHFKTFENFNSKKLSANDSNTKYTIGIEGEIQNGSPDILYQSIVYIKDTQQQWTHGQLYNCKDSNIKWSILKSQYEFVDLGLPSSLKWSTYNIGATKPEEIGLYFAWGETKGYIVTKDEFYESVDNFDLYNITVINQDGTETTKTFSQSDYIYYDSLKDVYTKYVDDSTLEKSDDGSTAVESILRIPTAKECQELIDNTTPTWVENYNNSNVGGLLLVSNLNNNSIFIPNNGAVERNIMMTSNGLCCFWTSSLYTTDTACAFAFTDGSGFVSKFNRQGGLPIRAVKIN